MIRPILKSDQTKHSALKSAHRIKKATEKVVKQKRAQAERGKVGARLSAMILERDGGKCCLCGAKPAPNNDVKLHIHHIVSIAAGGRSIEENLCTLCATCNIGSGARTIDMLKAAGHALK